MPAWRARAIVRWPPDASVRHAGWSSRASLGLAGFAILAAFVNPLTAWLNLASWVGYGLVYTLYLKRATPQNIVIGGLFGAAPPLFGWTAVTGSIEPGGLVLLAIIFIWTPPHFWALALDRIDDYRDADIPMLPGDARRGEHQVADLLLHAGAGGGQHRALGHRHERASSIWWARSPSAPSSSAMQ